MVYLNNSSTTLLLAQPQFEITKPMTELVTFFPVGKVRNSSVGIKVAGFTKQFWRNVRHIFVNNLARSLAVAS